jgi:hypothetical protein
MADSPTNARRTILAAGLLGGVLGGVCSFAANRMIVPAPAGKDESAAKSAADARPVVESFIGKLHSEAAEDLGAEMKQGRWLITEQEYASFRGQFVGDRARFAKLYGERTGEFELVREEALSPSLVRFVFLEKYQHDGVLWFFVVFRTMGDWRIVGVSWKDRLAVAVDAVK